MTTKIYNLGKSTKMVVTYNAANTTALIKCDHPLVMDGMTYRQEILGEKMVKNGTPGELIPDFTINYDGKGGLLINFKGDIMGLVKFSNWLLTDQALKQIKTAILECKMENKELRTSEEIEDLIDNLYGI